LGLGAEFLFILCLPVSRPGKNYIKVDHSHTVASFTYRGIHIYTDTRVVRYSGCGRYVADRQRERERKEREGRVEGEAKEF